MSYFDCLFAKEGQRIYLHCCGFLSICTLERLQPSRALLFIIYIPQGICLPITIYIKLVGT